MLENTLIQSRDGFLSIIPEEEILLNGRKWGLIRAGSIGPRLLLLPGTLGRADIFWQQIDALKDRCQILSVSYPEEYRLENWAADILALLEQENWEEVSVLGSSLGGYLAQYLVSSSPDRFLNLVAANTLCSTAEIQTKPPYSLDIQNIPIEKLRQPWIEGLEAGKSENPDRDQMTDLLIAEVNGRIPELELKARLMALNQAPQLPTNSFPNTKIYSVEADDDPLIPTEMREMVRIRNKPEIAYTFIEGGHFPYLIRAETYTAMLEEILGLQVRLDGWGTGSVRKK